MKLFFEAFNILPSFFKKRSIKFIILLLFASFFETLGIGLVIPVIEFISDIDTPNKIFLYEYLTSIKIINSENILFYVMFAFLLFYVLKNLFLIFFYYWNNKFCWNIYKEVSNNLLKTYISRPITYYFSKNSSELINNTMNECKFFSVIVQSYLKLIAEFSILISICTFLLFFEPLITLMFILLIGVFYFLFIKITKNKIYNLGKKRHEIASAQIKELQQNFESIKFIKLRSFEKKFIFPYSNLTKNFSQVSYLHGTLSELPKISLEVLFIASFVIMVFIFNSISSTQFDMIPILGLFAAAAFRILPSVNRIIDSRQQINFLKPCLEKIKNEFDFKASVNSVNNFNKPFDFKKDLKIQQLHYSYPNVNLPIINDISFSIEKNECVGIIGKSGSGKSTLADIIMGFMKPQQGKILVDNVDIFSNLKNWQNKIGYVPQSVYLLDDTIGKNIALGLNSDEINEKKLIQTAKDAQILEFINSLKDGFNTLVGERGTKLSGGQIQRLGIARALYYSPELLIFDEATSALDLDTEAEFLKSLEEFKGKKTIIIVSHRKSTLKDCNQIIELK